MKIVSSLIFCIPINRYSFLLLFGFLFQSISLTGQEKNLLDRGEILSVKALNVGDRVPDEFYAKEYKLFANNKAITTDLKHLKGKLIILDFWASWCGMCLTQMPNGEKLNQRYADTLAIVLVNAKHRRDDLTKIKKTYKQKLSRIGGSTLSTVYDDEYLIRLFPHASIPRYVWISPRGTVLAITGHSFVNSKQIDDVIDLLRGQGNYE